ncbi:GntR family transcriptional regulator [Jannaschia sp. S6380]|uniref:GntR family transcriptional regulator n=1 Tax=Jannaschia sp. S6380 TaxID=2926408 RepID=UPI001FF49178|nr:GntR family transcriptional regulator [Jannaschia sp. S6380]MCK0166782.1 GntR family transcriptional regulator [Jannaschia sp. S6380]
MSRAPPAFDPTALRRLDHYDGTLARRTYLALREAIVALRIAPGSALRKEEICRQLGVSRSPVSEAVTRLAAEGLIDIVPQAGSFVARLSMREIREGAFLREAIEVAAIEHLVPIIKEDQLRTLRRNLSMQAVILDDGDIAGFYELDGRMHALLLDFTGFRRIARIAESAWVHVDRARQLILPMGDRVRRTLDEHRAILTALEARDAPAAREAMRSHLRQLMTVLAPLEMERPDLFHPEDYG